MLHGLNCPQDQEEDKDSSESFAERAPMSDGRCEVLADSQKPSGFGMLLSGERSRGVWEIPLIESQADEMGENPGFERREPGAPSLSTTILISFFTQPDIEEDRQKIVESFSRFKEQVNKILLLKKICLHPVGFPYP